MGMTAGEWEQLTQVAKRFIQANLTKYMAVKHLAKSEPQYKEKEEAWRTLLPEVRTFCDRLSPEEKTNLLNSSVNISLPEKMGMEARLVVSDITIQVLAAVVRLLTETETE